MFKRMQKLNAKLGKSRARGELDEDAGPPELAMDDDSSSSGASSSGGSSNDGEEDWEGEGSDADASASAVSDDGDSDSDAGSAGASSGSSVDEVAVLRPSIAEVIREPIYILPGAESKQGFTHRRCYLCPKALLKNRGMIDTHVTGGPHTRRLKRFIQYTEREVTDEDKRDPREGGRDAPSVVDEIDRSLVVKEERQKKTRKENNTREEEAKRVRITAKKEAKKTAKAAKAAKEHTAKAAGNATVAAAAKKRKATLAPEPSTAAAIDGATNGGAHPDAESADDAVVDSSMAAALPKSKKAKRPVEKEEKEEQKEPLLPRAVRKERRKEKAALRQKRNFEARKAKRERKASTGGTTDNV